MPLVEFLKIITIFNDFKEREAEATRGTGTSSVQEARMSGTEIPAMFE